MTKYTSYLTSQKRPISKLCRNPKEPKHIPKETSNTPQKKPIIKLKETRSNLKSDVLSDLAEHHTKPKTPRENTERTLKETYYTAL